MHTTKLDHLGGSLRFARALLGVAGCIASLALGAGHAAAQSCVLPRDGSANSDGVYGGAWGCDSAQAAGTLLGCHQYTNLYTGTQSPAPDYVTKSKRAIAFRYLTSDAVGRKVPATGLLLVPASVPAVNGGKAPLVALTTGTAGVLDKCAPSSVLRTGAGLIGGSAGFYLGKGFTVVIVDYLGLGTQLGQRDGDDHPYLEGEAAAHTVLDALRAARKVPGGHYAASSAPVDPSWRVAVDGYSQGGSASQWAALRQPAYAPELPLAGAVVGAPAIDLKKTIERIDTSLFRSLFGMAFHALTNATNATTRVDRNDMLSNILTPTGAQVYLALEAECAVDYGVQSLADVAFGAYKLKDLVKDVDAFWRIPAVAAFIEQNSVKPNGVLRFTKPALPVFAYHGMADDVNPYNLHAEVMLDDWGAALGGTTLGLDAALARKDLAFQAIAFSSHATSSGLPRNDSNLADRYAPIEWLWDTLLKSPGVPASTTIRNNPDFDAAR